MYSHIYKAFLIDSTVVEGNVEDDYSLVSSRGDQDLKEDDLVPADDSSATSKDLSSSSSSQPQQPPHSWNDVTFAEYSKITTIKTSELCSYSLYDIKYIFIWYITT